MSEESDPSQIFVESAVSGPFLPSASPEFCRCIERIQQLGKQPYLCTEAVAMDDWDSDRFARELKDRLMEEGMPSMDLRVRFYLDGWVGVWIYNCEGTEFTLHRGYPHGMTHNMEEYVEDIVGAYQTRESSNGNPEIEESRPSAEKKLQ